MREPTKMNARTADALFDIAAERSRQELLKAEGRFRFTPADIEMLDGDRLGTIVEEVGEVARAMMEQNGAANDKHGVELRKELVQVGALCVAWIECLDKCTFQPPRSGDDAVLKVD